MCREFVVRVGRVREKDRSIKPGISPSRWCGVVVEWCAYVSISANGEQLKIVPDKREEDGQDRLFIHHIAPLFQFSS